MSNVKQVLLLFMVAALGCAKVRPITYPAPCLDRGASIFCQVIGYEVWGSRSQIQAQAKECPKSAHVTIDRHGDYGVVRCFVPEAETRESVAVVVVEKETTPDMVVSLKEAEAQAPMRVDQFEEPPPPEPVPEIRDQPRPAKPKAKRPKRRRRNLND
jgi:hypothetical protein